MELFSKANEAFVDENYEEAVELYTKAIQAEDAKDDFYANRAHAHIKLEHYSDAIEDCNKAISLNPKHSKAYLRKGIAQFSLQQYVEAKETLESCKEVDGTDKNIDLWIKKAEAELDSTQTEENGIRIGMSTPAKDSQQTTTSSSQPNSINTTQEIPMPTGQKTRYDWYQTETHVIVTILIKGVKKEDLTCSIQEQSLSVCLKLPSGSDYSLELDLLHPIVREKSFVKILSTKVEIKLKKRDGVRWNALEGDGTESSVKSFNPAAYTGSTAKSDSAGAKYPSSSHYTKDWDKLVADIKEEEKNEKPEGDAALNALFQQIYSDGNEETRRAMNKSFVESGGTVLSTNWKEIGDKKTEVKPPDGMEYKKYEQ